MGQRKFVEHTGTYIVTDEQGVEHDVDLYTTIIEITFEDNTPPQRARGLQRHELRGTDLLLMPERDGTFSDAHRRVYRRC